MNRYLNFAAIMFFFLAGAMCYAYVYDVEPISPQKAYGLERDVFNRHNDDHYREFPSFGEWLADQDDREARMRDWTNGFLNQVGSEFEGCWDWCNLWPSTNEGHAAAAPENWNNGRDD